MGILFPLPEGPDEAEKKATELACFKRPPRKYTASDRPWVSRVPSLMDIHVHIRIDSVPMRLLQYGVLETDPLSTYCLLP